MGDLRKYPGVDGMSGDVLVGHTVIDAPLAVLVGGGDRFFVGRGDNGFEYGFTLNPMQTELRFLLRAAIHGGGLLHHIDFLIGTDPGNATVVLDADKEASAVVVGKRGYAPGDLAGIGDLVLEVLMLVLALVD